MSRKSFFNITILIVTGLTGCVSVPLKPGAEKVNVTMGPVPKECKFITKIYDGDINGSPKLNVSNEKIDNYRHHTLFSNHEEIKEMEVNALKNKTLQLGANLVVITEHTVSYDTGYTRGGTFSYVSIHRLGGNVYKCPSNVNVGQLFNIFQPEKIN